MKLTGIVSSQFSATAYSAVILAVTTFLLGRYLGPSDFGYYTFVLTIISLYGIILDGGFKTLIFKERALTFNVPHVLQIASGHLIVFTLLGILFLVPFITDIPVLISSIIFYALFTLSDYVLFDLKGRGLFLDEAKWKTLQRTIVAFPVILLVFSPYLKPATVFAAYILGYVVWFALFRAGRMDSFLPKFDFSLKTYRLAAPFIFINIFTLIYFRADIVMIKYLKDVESVGQYAASYKFIEGLIFLLAPASHIFFQNIRKNCLDKAKAREIFFKALILFMLVSIVIVITGLIFAEDVITLSFGTGYLRAVPAFKILLCSMLFIIPNAVLTQTAIAFDKEKLYSTSSAISAALNIILNFFLIPRYGINGAAVATLATEGFLLCCLGFVTMAALRT